MMSRLVVSTPDVNTRDLALGKQSRSHQKHRTAPAAKIENLLIPAQIQAREKLCPNLEFAAPRRVNVAAAREQQECCTDREENQQKARMPDQQAQQANGKAEKSHEK